MTLLYRCYSVFLPLFQLPMLREPLMLLKSLANEISLCGPGMSTGTPDASVDGYAHMPGTVEAD